MADKIEIAKDKRYVHVHGGWGQGGNATKTNYTTIAMPSGKWAESASFKNGHVEVTMTDGSVREYESNAYSKETKATSKKPVATNDRAAAEPRKPKEKAERGDKKSFWSPWWAIPFKLVWALVKGLWWVAKKFMGR
jgi:hypothetical protein